MPDTTVIHIGPKFLLYDPLLYTNLTFYFDMTIFLSGLAPVCVYVFYHYQDSVAVYKMCEMILGDYLIEVFS